MPAAPSVSLEEPALMGELRSVEVVDFDDPAQLEADAHVDFGLAYSGADAEDGGSAGAAAHAALGDSSEEEPDEPARFTAPQTVTNEEYDAVQHLLKQAKDAKKEAKHLAVGQRKLEKQ